MNEQNETHGDSPLPVGWSTQLSAELDKEYWHKFLEFVTEERMRHDVFPSPSQTFAALDLTAFEDVRAVILGQDPYPTPGDAHGLAFSVPRGVPRPRSVTKIHEELDSDLGVPAPDHGNLEAWAREGVLLLNATLTLRAGSAKDHKVHRRWRWKRQGWQTFTNAVISAINAKADPVVFILWGADARRKAKLVDHDRHHVIESVHPSPLSAYRGFLGSRPFSRTNAFLDDAGRGTIDWGRIGDES